MTPPARPMDQLAGGPANGRTFRPGTLGRMVRIPVPQPITLDEGSGGARIARYTRSAIQARPDLYLFDGYEDKP